MLSWLSDEKGEILGSAAPQGQSSQQVPALKQVAYEITGSVGRTSGNLSAWHGAVRLRNSKCSSWVYGR